MSCLDGLDVHSHLAHYLHTVCKREDDAFLCSTQQVCLLVDVEVEAVDATAYLAVLQQSFGSVAEWYDAQSEFMNALDLSAYTSQPMFTDATALYEVVLNRKKTLLAGNAAMRLYGDRIEIDAEPKIVLQLSDLRAAAALGHNKLNLYAPEHVYQCKGSKRFNALKYVNVYYHRKNIDRGDTDGKFLGL